jgi:hypothetical protein
MWLSKMIEGLHKWRPGGAIRRKQRILDGKKGEWFDVIFEAPRW